MALELDTDAHTGNNCASIFFNELTGPYGILNLTGWGVTNPEISTVTATSIIITLPDAETIITITNPSGLPSTNPDVSYEIAAATLDEDWTGVEDGLYKIEYNVTSSDFPDDPYTITKYFLFTCNIECCIAKMFALIATATDCSCDSTVIKNALYADGLLQSLLGNKDCGNQTLIAGLLAQLNKICDSSVTDCGCGN